MLVGLFRALRNSNPRNPNPNIIVGVVPMIPRKSYQSNLADWFLPLLGRLEHWCLSRIRFNKNNISQRPYIFLPLIRSVCDKNGSKYDKIQNEVDFGAYIQN